MKLSIKKGLNFGLTSGVITTLGLIVGLNSSTQSSTVVIGGILVIAVADAMSDALGAHISEESKNLHSTREVWETTFYTFLAKFFSALVFIIPFLFFSLSVSIIICVAWGLGLITFLSYNMAKEQGIRPYSVIFEHLIIAIIVIIATQYIGNFVATFE